jgi:hypothetical protein
MARPEASFRRLQFLADRGTMLGIRFRNPLYRIRVHSSMSSLFRCPCCGYRTLKAPEAMELCPVCWWEDDGQEDADAAEVRLTVNGMLSLREARIHYQECGAAHPRYLPYVRRPEASEQ